MMDMGKTASTKSQKAEYACIGQYKACGFEIRNDNLRQSKYNL